MALIESASCGELGVLVGVVGTVASRSPEAMRPGGGHRRDQRPGEAAGQGGGHHGGQGQADGADQQEIAEAVGRVVDLSGDHHHRQVGGDRW